MAFTPLESCVVIASKLNLLKNEDSLKAYFAKFGKIMAVKYVSSKKPQAVHAFILFSTAEEANAAVIRHACEREPEAPNLLVQAPFLATLSYLQKWFEDLVEEGEIANILLEADGCTANPTGHLPLGSLLESDITAAAGSDGAAVHAEDAQANETGEHSPASSETLCDQTELINLVLSPRETLGQDAQLKLLPEATNQAFAFEAETRRVAIQHEGEIQLLKEKHLRAIEEITKSAFVPYSDVKRELKAKELQLEERDQHIASLLAELEIQITEGRATVDTVNEITATLKKVEPKIKSLKLDVEEREQQIAVLQTTINKRDTELYAVRQQVVDLTNQYNELTKDLVLSNANSQDLEMRLKDQTEQHRIAISNLNTRFQAADSRIAPMDAYHQFSDASKKRKLSDDRFLMSSTATIMQDQLTAAQLRVRALERELAEARTYGKQEHDGRCNADSERLHYQRLASNLENAIRDVEGRLKDADITKTVIGGAAGKLRRQLDQANQEIQALRDNERRLLALCA